MDAAARIERLVDNFCHCIALNEANKIVVYSNVLSQQIPPSYAAHAFNVLQGSLHRFEILRLCTLWDTAAADRESIPSVVALIDSPEVLAAILVSRKNDRRGNANFRVPEGLEDAEVLDLNNRAKRIELRFSARLARRAVKRVQMAIRLSRRVQGCSRFQAIMDTRHHQIAHSLKPGTKKKAPNRKMKYGDELALFSITQMIIDWLNIGVRGSGFDWDSAKEISARNAIAFWGGVSIKVQR